VGEQSSGEGSGFLLDFDGALSCRMGRMDKYLTSGARIVPFSPVDFGKEKKEKQ